MPRLFPDLCTKRVLTMEFVDGVRASEPERVGGDHAAVLPEQDLKWFWIWCFGTDLFMQICTPGIFF